MEGERDSELPDFPIEKCAPCGPHELNEVAEKLKACKICGCPIFDDGRAYCRPHVRATSNLLAMYKKQAALKPDDDKKDE